MDSDGGVGRGCGFWGGKEKKKEVFWKKMSHCILLVVVGNGWQRALSLLMQEGITAKAGLSLSLFVHCDCKNRCAKAGTPHSHKNSCTKNQIPALLQNEDEVLQTSQKSMCWIYLNSETNKDRLFWGDFPPTNGLVMVLTWLESNNFAVH